MNRTTEDVSLSVAEQGFAIVSGVLTRRGILKLPRLAKLALSDRLF